jgi:hypothetical protein
VHQDGKSRLLRRSIIHAVDQRSNKLSDKNTKCSIVTYNNTPAILICHQINASMRPAHHNVVVCFNKDMIIASKCDCQAGCFVNGRALCVHIIPILYQITLLLFDGLAETLIIEFANHWQQISMDMDQIMKEEVKTNLLILKNATRYFDDFNED